MELTYTLNNFEGPLPLLLYLVQKGELDICELVLQQLVSQFAAKRSSISIQGEFLTLLSSLLLLKTRKLLPQSESTPPEEDEELRLAMLEQILEYSRFKEAALGLSEREQRVQATFVREAPPPKKPQQSGLEEVSLEELTSLLKKVLKRAEKEPTLVIKDEEISLSEKILWLKSHLFKLRELSFEALFTQNKRTEELIVLFLAVLELMKEGILAVRRIEETITFCYSYG